MMKLYKGQIHDWEIGSAYHPDDINGMPHMNIVVRGRPIGHPQFDRNFIRTSCVVSMAERELKDGQFYTDIETLNSRYTLVGEGKVNN